MGKRWSVEKHDKEAAQNRAKEFRIELDNAITSHRRRRSFDGFMHQSLVIGAALAGFVSLVFGLYFKNAEAAGIVGAVTSVATILTQQLHCVKAQSWHDRMVTEIEGIRLRLSYELKASPTLNDLAKLSKILRDVKLKMSTEWEKVISSQSTKLGDLKVK